MNKCQVQFLVFTSFSACLLLSVEVFQLPTPFAALAVFAAIAACPLTTSFSWSRTRSPYVHCILTVHPRLVAVSTALYHVNMAQQHHPGQGLDVPAPTPQAQVQQADVNAILHDLHNEVLQQRAHILRLEQQQQVERQQSSCAIRPPKPDTFDGRHCDTFIYSLEKLFDYHGETNSARRVALAITYLRGSALRWYKCAEKQDTNRQLQQWDSFIIAMRSHFEASNIETLVRNKLANLKQLTSVAKYNDLFNSLIIEIADLDPRSKLDMYIRGLKPQVQLHLTLKEPTNLESAQRLALNIDGILVETGFARGSNQRNNNQNKSGNRYRNNRFNRSNNHSYRSSTQSVPMELGQAEDEMAHEDDEQDGDTIVASAQSNYKGQNRLSAEDQKRLMREGKCFNCGKQGHLARDCPNRERYHQKND